VSTDLNIEMVRESLTETGQWPWRRHSGLTLHIYRRRFSDDRLLYSGCVRKWYQCLYGLAYIGAPKVINCSEGYFYIISVTTLLLHCDKPVSLYVCLSVRTHISAATCTKFATLSVHVTCGCGSVLLKLRCDMLRISGFVDDVVLHTVAEIGDTKRHIFKATQQMAVRIWHRDTYLHCFIGDSTEQSLGEVWCLRLFA